MTDDDLLSQIEHLERQAHGYFSSEVAAEQQRAMDYYFRKPFGTEVPGRSAVVSSDVWDAVEGMTPAVLRPFVATDDAVAFAPLGPDDEEAAKQESDYINWVVTQKNDSFAQLVNWCKTGLLQKTGVVKWWWDKSRRPSIERYDGLSDDAFALVMQEPGVEVVQHTETTLDDGTVVHDCVLRVVEEVGQARFEVVPPEEVLVSRDATLPDPQVARFVQHRRIMTIGEVRAMGYDVADDIADGMDSSPQMSGQFLSRHEDEGLAQFDEGLDPTMREVLFRETYFVVDYDGDGMPELRKVCAIGREILSNEETEEIPFAAWTPYQQPFKFYGQCPADEAQEFQLIKSALLRQNLDNLYTINNNRVFVSDRVTLDDLIDNQIGGYVRVPGTQGIQNDVLSAPITPIGGVVQPMIEYLDASKENRLGFTRYNQGLDATSLNKTATGVRIIAEAGNQRLELIARQFANGMVALMRGIHGLCRRHATQAETVRLRGKWVQIDPRAWRKRIDMVVNVGLGLADQQMKLQGLQALMMEQKAQAGAQIGTVTPENFYNAAAKMTEALGFKSPEMFFTPPQPQAGLPPEVQAVLQQAQAEIQALRAENQQLKTGAGLKLAEIQSRERIAQTSAVTQERVAEIGAEVRRDVAELGGLVQIIAKKMDVPVPESLQGEVEDDLSEEEPKKPDATELMAQALQMLAAPKNKRMRIVAPSGQVYEGEIAEGQ